MKTIYVIMELSGSYDSYDAIPVSASFDMGIAEAEIKRLEKENLNRVEQRKTMNAFYLEWEIAHPCPRLAIVNKKIGPELTQLMNEWTAAFMKMRREYTQSLNLPEDEVNKIQSATEDISWDIEEIPVLE